MELETIKTLAEKLRALAAPDSGATENEKQIAADKLKAILGRNKLTMEEKHNIFPDSPSDKPSKETTLEEMKAMLRAIQHTGGTTWTRPSANIENPILHLT